MSREQHTHTQSCSTRRAAHVVVSQLRRCYKLKRIGRSFISCCVAVNAVGSGDPKGLHSFSAALSAVAEDGEWSGGTSQLQCCPHSMDCGEISSCFKLICIGGISISCGEAVNAVGSGDPKGLHSFSAALSAGAEDGEWSGGTSQLQCCPHSMDGEKTWAVKLRSF